MQVVEDQGDRRQGLDERHEGLERIDRARGGARRAHAHLREHGGQRRKGAHVHLGCAEHLAKRERERRVRDAGDELGAARPADGGAVEVARRSLQQRRLADSELPRDQHQVAAALARRRERLLQVSELCRAAEQANRRRAGLALGGAREGLGARRRVDRLAPLDRVPQRVQCRGERRGLRLGDRRAGALVEGDRVAVAPEGLECDESGVVAALVQRLEADCALGMREGAAGVPVQHGRGGRSDAGIDDASLVAPALVHRPVAVGLVSQHRAGRERQGVLEVAPARRRLGDLGEPYELVEAIEIELVPAVGRA